MVIRDVEREDIGFICKTIGAKPIAHIDGMKPEKLGYAGLVDHELQSDGTKVLKVTGLREKPMTSSILVRGSNNLVTPFFIISYFKGY